MTKYGLIGYPLGHSFSAGFFNEKFQREHIDALYENYEIPDISQLIGILKDHQEIKGLNVTIPYKEQVIPLLHSISDEAKAIGAVNVISVCRKNGKMQLTGHNTDVTGFKESINPLLKSTHRKALILGTGGASKAVDYALNTMGIETAFVSRSTGKGSYTYKDLTPDMIKEYPVIINCSPVGMYPHMDECPPLPYEAMDNNNLLYDLIYNPQETLFLKKGKLQGATVKNGLEMLHMQAYAAWDIWQSGK